MKQKYIQGILLIFFTAAVGFVVLKNTNTFSKTAAYELMPRKGNDNQQEWVTAKANVEKLQSKIKANPDDSRSLLALANAYITESRISGNIAYYDQAALQTVEIILSKKPDDYEALMLKSLVQLSQHHFAEGLATAQKAVSIDSNSAFVYGLLVDANVEMGNYQAAVDAADKMVTIRPDMRSYSRISYLREIHGDYAGAVIAMKAAVQAGIPGEESTEWCRVQMGRLYENMGDLNKASFQYNLTLAARPGYAYALAGLGRIASFEKKYDSALFYFEQASTLISDIGIKENLSSAYSNAGLVQKASVLNKEVVEEMNRAAKSLIKNPDAGHYSDKEQAYVYLKNNNTDKALEHALAEYKRRPKNIDVNELMAWVYFNRNEADKAIPYLNAAFVTKSKSPQLLCIAGLIYGRTGDTIKGKEMLAMGQQNHPIIMESVQKAVNEAATSL